MKKSFTLISSSYRSTRSVDNMNFTIPYIKSCQDQTQGSKFTLANSQNASRNSVLRVENIGTRKKLRVHSIFQLKTFE